MLRKFEFVVQRQENLVEGMQPANIYGFKLIRSKNSEIPLICIRHGPNLIAYRFDVATESWLFHWKESIFNESDDHFNSIDFHWFVGDILGNASDMIVIRNRSGLVFLQSRENLPGVDRLNVDTRFGSDANIFTLIGNFFNDKSVLGVLKRSGQGDVRMYRTMKNLVGSRDEFQLYELPNLIFAPSWQQTETKIFLADLRGQGQDVFVLLTVAGLEIYEFDQGDKLIELMRTRTIKRSSDMDNLFFGKFTNPKFKDIIHLNDDGLFLYKYHDKANDVTLVNHNTDFTIRNGWRSLFADSVQIFDIDNDGIDELIFTGTNGLNVHTFNMSLSKWENILGSTKLNGLLQYSRVVGMVKISAKVTAFSQDSNGGLQRMNLIESKNLTIPVDIEDPKKKFKPFQSSAIQPTIISRMSHHEVPVLRWTEQWDAGFLKEAVRPQTGQVEFSIPLFKTGPIPALQSAIGISYNSREDSAELMGVGWTLPIADYYITVDHKGSIFPIDYDYYLIREGRKAYLHLKEYKIDSMEFGVVEQPELKILYDVGSEKWTVGNDIEQITFGDDQKFGALKIQLNWSNWRGSGTDTSELKPFIHSWYLSERRFLETDSSVYYKYETTSAIIAGKAYTTSIRLISITDVKEFHINFEYSTKTDLEYKSLLSPFNAEKVLTFPLQLVQSHYVKSCNVQTASYQQKLNFDYQLRNGKRLLVQISQQIKGNTESIFAFDYKDELNNFIMSTCQFMNKVHVSFDYTRTTSLMPPFSLQYSVNERPQVTFGSDYAVMAYKVKNSVEFRLTNRVLTIPIFKGTTARSNGIVQSFAIAAYHNSFIISQTTGVQVDIFTFSKEKDNAWSETPTIETFHQLSLLCYSEKFYAVAEPNTNKVLIVERDYGQSKWKRFVLNNPDNVKLNRLVAHNHMIVGLADERLILYYKNGVNDWTSDIIDRDEAFRTTGKEMIFDRDRLQLFNNVIVASGLQEKDGNVMIVAKLYLLDAKRKIAKTFVQNVTAKQSKIQLSKDGLFIGDDTFLRMTGTEWQKENRLSRDYVMLGKSFVLGFDHTETTSVYFHYQKSDGTVGDLIKHIKLNGPGQFINRYPAYLSYQLDETKVIVQTFKDPKTLGKEESYTGEVIMDSSNLTNLMTIAKVGTRFEWRVRSLSNFMDKKFYSIVEKWSITNDHVSRTTAYERSSTYQRDERVVEESLRIIPGGNKDVSGWIEHVLLNNMETLERTSTTNYYDALGNVVSGEKRNATDAERTNDKNVSEGSSQMTQQIFDKTGHLEISNFAPYIVSDDEGLYLGFESYEDNQGVEFDAASVIRGKFAFTGESYLNLQQSDRLTKVLQPKDTNNIFIASCYVRSSSPITLESEVKYVRALITAERLEAKEIMPKILRQSGEWFYLESYIDLMALTRQHGQLQGLQITIEITSESDTYIDLDHIRFSPLTQNFEASVFNPQSGKVTAKITDNGLVSRTIFDRQNREIGTIKNNEQVEHFTRATKTGEIFPSPRTPINQQPSSKLKFEPESGFYEHFDATAFSDRWSVSEERVWAISRGQLIHRGVFSDTITLNANLIDESCAALRFGYNLRLIKSAITLRWSSNISITFSALSDNQATLTMHANRSAAVDNLPVSGELLIFIEVERVVVWIDGVLIIDQGHGYGNRIEPWSDFKFEMTNYLVIEDLFIMNRPRISLEYFNGFGEKVQVLQFESDKVIHVSQTLYDELGRNVIVTKPTKISRTTDQTLFAFYPEFVHNDNPTDSNSVWKTGLLKGDVDTLNKNDLGVPYFQTKFDINPLNEKVSEGLPGADYSVTGPNAKHFTNTSTKDFMSNLFPTHSGYKKQAEILPNGSERISVIDSKRNIIARCTRVTGSNYILSTFEYDDDNQLIKILPPLYHELVKTLSKTQQLKNGNEYLTATEKKLQETYGSHFTYDKGGRLIAKITPDSGTVKYIYTSDGSLRFMATVGPDNVAKRVVYLFYDEFQQLVRTGHISSPITLTELQYYLQGNWIPNAVDYQLVQYSDQNENTLERGFMKSLVTYSGLEPVKEIIRFNNDFDVSQRDIHGLPQQISFDISSPAISIIKDYNRKRVATVTYPGIYKAKLFKLFYTYDKLGNVIALGTENNHKRFATFTYHINGLVAMETHIPTSESSFSRLYEYNSPGHLERITDPYLTEDISYTNGGYAMNGFGDDTILLTTYNPKWADHVDRRLFRVHDTDAKFIPAACIAALKRLGYLDSLNNPKRMYIPEADLSMPLKCKNGEVGLRIAKVVAEKHVPRFYGYRFAYGNYKELINAKYFTDETHRLIEPLQRQTFSKFINRLSNEQSQEIFDILARNKFILSDWRTGQRYGRQGETFFRDKDLERDLKNLNDVFGSYSSVIMALLTFIISQRKSMSLDAFQSQFVKWHDMNSDITVVFLQKTSGHSTAIFEMLKRNGYMTQRAFKADFINILSKYNDFLPEIVAILNHHFIHALGRTPFDVEVYNIDANGNHRMFDVGFKRYKFAYKDGISNRIAEVKINYSEEVSYETSYKMEHDADGNVVQALHKNIEAIEYNRTSQKPTVIRMSDGRKLMFFYDAQGERILKRVSSASGVITNDTYYIRDEEKRVLLERRIAYFPNSQETTVTMYIHGPRGLIGFIRDDKFHSVITDHTGSVRLIIRDGMVIAAFDYLPYGKTMRLYYTSPRDLVSYRYMGQEFDEETELYNYNSRLYDPDIGRFYQLDLHAQYYSPYKYSGNSYMDSVGESHVAATVMGTNLAISEAYLGGSADAHDRWNKGDQNLRHFENFNGIIDGGISGALLPIDFRQPESETISQYTTGMYLSASTANGNWDPNEWKWDSPITWNGLFEGFATGASLTGGSIAEGVKGRTSSDVMANNGNAAFWEWDLTNPDTWNAILSGYDSGIGMPNNFVDVGRSFRTLAQNPNELTALLRKVNQMPSTKSDFDEILKNPSHPLYKVAVISASADNFESDRNGDSNVKNSKNTFGTYYETSNGVFFARNPMERITTSMVKRKQPEMMVDLISYRKIDSHRVRRTAMVSNDEIYLSSTFNVTRELTNLTDSSQSIPDAFIVPTLNATSGSSRITFWPSRFFQMIKSTFHLATQYFEGDNKLTGNSEHIPLSSNVIVPPEPLANYCPHAPGVQSNELEDNYSILRMGDQWLVNTNMQSNLLLAAFIFMRKLLRYKSDASKLLMSDNFEAIELGIQAYEIVTDFLEHLTAWGGDEELINKIVDSGDLDYLFHAVKVKLMRRECDEIAKILFDSLNGKNISEIGMMSSPKKVNLFRERIEKKIFNLNNR